ncbi:MAG: putative secreted hydrolase [Marmoricola sp.]|nr:putative secreted hydrolase [Marmoricola sp.]
MRRRLLSLSLSAASALGLGVAGIATAPTSTATGGLDYVAMGDSYSAGSGVEPPAPGANPSCTQSLFNYPHVIAGRIGARLTDVTCGGAETKDYREPQFPGVAPQLDALGTRTRLVTMTIGGNDSGVFINSVARCGALGVSTAGQGSPCKDAYGSSFEDTIRTTTYPAIVKALRDVHAKAPHARVSIADYPWIVPTQGRCFPQLPIADGDVPYLRSLQATLNDAVRRAAAATGTTYVTFGKVSEGHDACKPLGVRWIEPVVGTTNPVIVHPNALGESEMADEVMRTLRLG